VSQAQVRRAIDEINGFAGQIEFVIVAGDLGQSARQPPCRRAASGETAGSRLLVPYHVAIGNHDVTTAGDDTAFRLEGRRGDP
jgi:hypothetical protein